MTLAKQKRFEVCKHRAH